MRPPVARTHGSAVLLQLVPSSPIRTLAVSPFVCELSHWILLSAIPHPPWCFCLCCARVSSAPAPVRRCFVDPSQCATAVRFEGLSGGRALSFSYDTWAPHPPPCPRPRRSHSASSTLHKATEHQPFIKQLSTPVHSPGARTTPRSWPRALGGRPSRAVPRGSLTPRGSRPTRAWSPAPPRRARGAVTGRRDRAS